MNDINPTLHPGAGPAGVPDLPGDTDDAAGVRRSHLHFPVVGIGASAGGLAALTRFFEATPRDTGMAYVVILHLSPKHKSHAAEILQRASALPVAQVTETVQIEANRVYVVPPSHQLAMSDGSLVLTEDVRSAGRHIAIDAFFRTLAHAHREHAIGVVLSGTGADGAVGIARIKEQGGVTLVQAPDDAEHEDMPLAAIATGQVDFVMSAADMPERLATLEQTQRQIRLPADIAEDARVHAPLDRQQAHHDEEALRDVMNMLRTRTQHDFKPYKRATVLRRIERRMQVTATTSLPHYRDHLRDHLQETPRLLQDMLISVTNFFRDREAFEALERDVLPHLVAQVPTDQPLRAWVAGCASGEEAYSVAMLLHEACQDRSESAQYQLFASDIDDRALHLARAGLYPASIAGDMAPARLRRYMQPERNRYRVAKSLRDRILFAQHNLLSDPPFSRLDFIACRNLLIYLDREAQAAVLQTLRFALQPAGVLFLGSSESVEVVSDLFEPIDKHHRLYRANAGSQWHRTAGRVQMTVTRRSPFTEQPPPQSDKLALPYAELHQRALLHALPASVLLDGEHDVLHLSDGAAAYLQVQTGVPTFSLVNNIHPSLRLELRSALFKARQSNGPVEARAWRDQDDGTQRLVHMVVRPYVDEKTRVQTVLVTFDETSPPLAGTQAVEAGAGAGGSGELEAEVVRLRGRLRETLEQAETSTEELKSSNEELQAINEELRSATEELETSKEELQSLNEELVTVNYELSSKVEETGRINDDLRNLIASTDIATVFVDGGLQVKRYTPRAAELFNLIEGDVGRSLLDITHRLVYDELTSDAEAAFQNLRPVEREVSTRDGRLFLARFLPYRTAGDHIEGVVLTFIDVTALRAAEHSAHEKDEKLRVALESTKEIAVAVTDTEGHVLHWNAGAQRVFGWTAEEITGRSLDIVFTEDDRARGVPEAERRTAAQRGHADDERWHLRKDGSRFFCSGVMTPFNSGRHTGFAKIARDMTGSKHTELAREELLQQAQSGRRQAQAAAQAKDEFLAIMSHELKHPLNLISINAQLLARLPQLRDVEPAVRAVQTIERTLAAQAKIVDDLLDLSRARTGKLTLQLLPLDWSATVRAIVEAVQPDAQAKGVQLVLEGADEPLQTMFDRVRAEQVVWNLLSNALKFTPSGGSIRVSLAAEPQWLRLTVADTGKGIDPSYIGKVFDMFSQESSIERRRESGLGVGLALVREVITAHGGRVSAASPGTGKGATFTVRVPRNDVVEAAPADRETSSVLRGMRVLLVDDSVDTVFSLGTLMRLTGATVVTAVSGAEALRALADDKFDLLLSDVSMPDMSGLDLIRTLRAKPGGSLPLAIACSGFARQLDDQRALAAGFDAQLPKPLSLADLESTVSRLRVAHAADGG